MERLTESIVRFTWKERKVISMIITNDDNDFAICFKTNDGEPQEGVSIFLEKKDAIFLLKNLTDLVYGK